MITSFPFRSSVLAFAAFAALLTQSVRADVPAAPTPAKHFVTLKADPQGRLGIVTPLQGVHRIVCLGDSITQFGDGPTGYVGLIRAYLTQVEAPLPIEVLNAGVSGNTSNDELGRLSRDVLDKRPDLVTVSVGVNDVWHGFDPAHPQGGGPGGVLLPVYQTNVEKRVTAMQQQGIVVALLSPTVIGEDLNDPRNAVVPGYVAALQDIARTHKCLYVDQLSSFETYLDLYRTTGHTDNLLTGDGVHVNDWGNRIMAARILSALMSPAPKGVTLHAL